MKPMSCARILASLFMFAQVTRACTCVESNAALSVPPPSYVLFRGTVTKLERLPAHPKMRGRQRYAVTFLVSQYWKGKTEKTITLYDLDPGIDCLGDGFQNGREYLVSATKEKAADSQPDPDFFWYGWTDVVPAGTLIFRSMACMPGGPISSPAVQDHVRKLGKGQTPKRVD